jgi:Mg-chelatase subunit ChlD
MWDSCLACAVLGLLAAGCGRDPSRDAKPKTGGPPGTPGFSVPWTIDLPQTEPRAGTAVAILIDTSGSMGQSVRDAEGQQRPKHEIAREALRGIIGYTGGWKKDHADRLLYLGIYHFSSNVAAVLPMGEFDQAAAEASLAKIPKPNSGTAIGRALEEGFRALYGSGCVRKYVVCITDGDNTSGPPPDVIARQLHNQTKGDVEIHFVAFDVEAAKFRFLRDVNGDVVQAADGPQLQSELAKIYEKRILAEAEEPEPKK